MTIWPEVGFFMPREVNCVRISAKTTRAKLCDAWQLLTSSFGTHHRGRSCRAALCLNTFATFLKTFLWGIGTILGNVCQFHVCCCKTDKVVGACLQRESSFQWFVANLASAVFHEPTKLDTKRETGEIATSVAIFEALHWKLPTGDPIKVDENALSTWFSAFGSH